MLPAVSASVAGGGGGVQSGEGVRFLLMGPRGKRGGDSRVTAPITIGSFGGIKGHLVPIWPPMNRASSAAAAAAAAWAFSDSRGRGVGGVGGVRRRGRLTMPPLLTAVEEGGGRGRETEPCAD